MTSLWSFGVLVSAHGYQLRPDRCEILLDAIKKADIPAEYSNSIPELIFSISCLSQDQTDQVMFEMQQLTNELVEKYISEQGDRMDITACSSLLMGVSRLSSDGEAVID